MCKTDEKTSQNYFFTARRNVPQKLRKLALQKHMMSFIIDFEPNTTVFHSCTIATKIWENKKMKAKNSRKLKTQTENGQEIK